MKNTTEAMIQQVKDHLDKKDQQRVDALIAAVYSEGYAIGYIAGVCSRDNADVIRSFADMIAQAPEGHGVLTVKFSYVGTPEDASFEAWREPVIEVDAT